MELFIDPVPAPALELPLPLVSHPPLIPHTHLVSHSALKPPNRRPFAASRLVRALD
jgi:hypothetical protein